MTGVKSSGFAFDAKSGNRARPKGFWVAQRFSAAVQSQKEAALAAGAPMGAPRRGNTGHSTYFITASSVKQNNLFQTDRMANLFVGVLFHYRDQEKYLLHEFVLMQDHFHLLITPIQNLEHALQLIKGGFSFRATKELGFTGEIWQTSYYDRRVRGWEDYERFRTYIHQNDQTGTSDCCQFVSLLQFRRRRVCA